MQSGEFASPWNRIDRRRFLQIQAGLGATLGCGSWATSSPLLASSAPAPLFRDLSVIFLFMHGGPSQYETFDPKMELPASMRSRTGEIPTSLPGITFGSTFQQLAKRAHLFNVIRSFVPGNGNHDIKPIMSKDSLSANMGSLYSRAAGALRNDSAMPTNIMLYPSAVESDAGPPIKSFGDFESSGDLGHAFAPFVLGAGQGLQDDMRLHLSRDRLEDRRSLIRELDRLKHLSPIDRNLEGLDAFQQQAFDALLRDVSAAFDLSKEDASLVARYDTRSRFSVDRIDKKWNNHKHYVDHGTSIGKLLLLARRLCERGVGFVTLTTSFVWDMHADINNAPMDEGMDYVGAPFDHAVATFMDDVEARGLRDKILLVCCGEMGRTPKINAAGGRDHWGGLGPLLIYGGGTRGGQVIGRSSYDGGNPATPPITIPDLIATILHRLLDIERVRLASGLPKNFLDLLGKGNPIRELG